MKAAVVFTLLAGAYATPTTGCVIPAQYASSTGVNCADSTTGYKVFGTCTTGPAAADTVGTVHFQEELTTANQDAFSSADAMMAPEGCIIPVTGSDWTAAGLTVAGLEDVCGVLGGAADNTGAITLPADPTVGGYHGVRVECAADFYPVQGWEGTAVCFPPEGLTVGGNLLVPPAVDMTAAFWSAGGYEGFSGVGTMVDQADEAKVTQFEGENMLLCAPACTLPTNVCDSATGKLYPNIVSSNKGFGAGCTLKPQHKTYSAESQPYFHFSCASFKANVVDHKFVATCNPGAPPATGGAPAAVPATSTYEGECGSLNGLSSEFLHVADHTEFPTGKALITQTAGEIANFPGASSTFGFVANGAKSAQIRYWNNNGPQVFQTGSAYKVDVSGCGTTVGDAQTQCVQQTLNWWHCKYDVPVDSSVCYAGGNVVPCPTHELGFRCPSSSKKGLLGLLGLLLIPALLCLLCCPLLLCCLRRKKTEADVHFATFDPLGAPQATACAAPTAFGCPTAFGATPFAQSAVPML